MRRLGKIALMIATVGIIIGIGIMMPKEVKAAPTPPDSHDASYYDLGYQHSDGYPEYIWLRTYGTGYFTSTDGIKYQFTVAEGVIADEDGNILSVADLPSNPFLTLAGCRFGSGEESDYCIFTEGLDSICALGDGIAQLETRVLEVLHGIYNGSSAQIDHEIAGERFDGFGLLGLSRFTSSEDEDDEDDEDEEEEIEYIDYDTFKSEFASGTATASIPGNGSRFFDFKGHSISKMDAGNAVFPDFILRPATNVTLFTLQ